MDWIIYNTTSHPQAYQRGVITHTVSGTSAEAAEYIEEHQALLEASANPLRQYVDVALLSVAEKQPLDATLSKPTVTADGVDTVSLSGLPVPCFVMVNETIISVPDGVLDFSTEVAGLHYIQPMSVEYLEERFEVYAI